MDRARLFRVLYYLTHEQSLQILAQDGFVVLRQCLAQLSDLDVAIADFKKKAVAAGPEKESEYMCEERIAKLEEMKSPCPELLGDLNQLQEEAKHFWLCAPLDDSHKSGSVASNRWKHFVDGQEPLPRDTVLALQTFRTRLSAILDLHFTDLLHQLREEQMIEEAQLTGLECGNVDLVNCIPIAWKQRLGVSTHVYIVSCRFPASHFQHADARFAQLLGCSVARLLAWPLVEMVIENNSLSGHVSDLFDKGVKAAEAKKRVTLSYRTSRRTLRTIQWECCSETIDGCFPGLGVDITDELDAFKENNSASTQKMLRQWLHSIRNASFEQQAAILLDELQELRISVGENPHLESRFDNLSEGLTMLMKTAKRSVGLIDHALDTKGFIQLLSVHDFIENLATFPSVNGAASTLPAGIHRTKLEVTCLLNEIRVIPEDVSGLFVKCDVLNIQAFINKLIISCASCTDPSKGLEIFLSIDKSGSSYLKFRLYICDFCPGGLSPSLFTKWQESLGRTKCIDARLPENSQETRVPKRFCRHAPSAIASDVDTSCRSMDQDLVSIGQQVVEELQPSIFDLRTRFLHSQAAADGDFSVYTFSTGTTYKLRFNGGINTPSSQLESTPDMEADVKELKGCLLVVDDSKVILKIIGKILEGLKVKFHQCRDGLEASHWIKENHASCAGILTDLEMPNVGGDALIALATEIDPDLPCYVVSGTDIAPVNLPQGARRAITKPISSNDIYSVLREILNMQSETVMLEKARAMELRPIIC